MNVEVETTAGNSREPQLKCVCNRGISWSIAEARWQLSSAVAFARPQFWPAQSGAQAGATRRATSVIRLNALTGQLASRIRPAFLILSLRYACHWLAST